MALLRAAGLCRLLRTPFAAARLLSAAGGEVSSGSGEEKQPREAPASRERALRPPAERARPAARLLAGGPGDGGEASDGEGKPRIDLRAQPPERALCDATAAVRAQHAPRDARRRPGPPTAKQLRLNRDILGCATAEAVLDLVAANNAILNEVNAATALLRASKLAQKRGAARLRGDERFAQLMKAAESLLGSMDAHGLSNAFYGCGQLGIPPSADWVQRFWDASAMKLYEFSPQNFSNTLYACGELGITPPADWLRLFWRFSVAKLPDFKPRELSITLYAYSRLDVVPPSGWLQRFLEASAFVLGDFGPQELSNTLHACGKLGIQPPASWLRRFWDVSTAKLAGFEPPHLSTTLYACRQLGITPPGGWLQRAQSVLADASHQSVVALPKQLQLNKAIRARLTPEAVLDLVAANRSFLNGVNAATALLTIMRRLNAKPDAAPWLSGDARFAQLMRTAELLMVQMEAQGLSNALYACGQLKLKPSPSWLRAFWDASASKLGDFNPQGLANTLYACVRLGVTPPDDWLQRYWRANAWQMGELIPEHFTNTLRSCGQLDTRPPADWVERFWHASALKMDGFIPKDFATTLYACGKLGIVPPDYWLQRFWHFSAPKLPDFHVQTLSNAILGCGQLCIMPPADWLKAFSRELERALPDMHQQTLSNTALALALLGLWELPVWPRLWKRLCLSLSRDIAGWTAEDHLDAIRLYQAHQAAAIERAGLLAAPIPELLAAARESWVAGTDTDSESTRLLRGEVSAALSSMGVAHASDHWCDSNEASAGRAIATAIEVLGPSRFLQDGRQNGSSLLRNRMLAAHGWRIVTVDHRMWDKLRTPEQREEYLRRLLA